MNKFSTFFLLFFSFASANAQLINPGFEEGTDTIPSAWTLSDLGASRTSSYSHSGDYSLCVWNWYYYSEGYSVNGNLENAFLSPHEGGTPLNFKPLSLSGYYRYDTTGTESVADSAVIEVLLKKYNLNTTKRDTVALGHLKLGATNLSQGFVPFEVPIHDWMPEVQPDSIVIVFRSAVDGFCNSSGAGDCLYFYIDDLTLNMTTGFSIPYAPETKTKIWPNPATDYIITEGYPRANHITLRDINGKILDKYTPENKQTRISVSHLPSGIYFLEWFAGRQKLGVQAFAKN